MRLFQYIADQRWLVITFLAIILFNILVILLDPAAHIHVSSVVYIAFISMLLASAYLAMQFFMKKKHIQRMLDAKTMIQSYPAATSNEQEVYFKLLNEIHGQYLTDKEELRAEQKEHLEYMTSWFHDIKIPISVSRLILETEVASPSLEEEIRKIEDYVEQALYFSRLTEFNKDYLIQEIPLSKMIKETIKTDAKSFIAKKIKLNLQLCDVEVLSDRKGLSFIIRQLLMNALKYSSKHGEIRIEILKTEKTLVIRDHGIGISPEDLPRVFDKGFTGKNGREYQTSTGMGLFLAKKLADKLGHELTIHSVVGSYTEARLSFFDTYDLYYKLEKHAH